MSLDRVGGGRWTLEDDQALRARYPHEPTAPLARALCPNDCHRNVARLSIERGKQSVECCQALGEVQSMCLVERPYDGVLEADTVIV